MSDFQRALSQLDETYQLLFTLLDRYPSNLREKQGVCGIWSPREVMAHLSGWIVIASKRYDDFTEGDTRNIYFDADPVNAKSVETRAHLTWDEAISELRSSIQAFLQRARNLPEDLTINDFRFQEWPDGLRADCIEHIGQLETFITMEG